MFVIGVAGQCQMGKDTLADRLAERLNAGPAGWRRESLDWERKAFAYAVKKVFMDTFGVDMDFIEKWKVIPTPPPGFGMTVRQALQFIGDGFRQIKGTIWLDIAFRDKATPVVLSDVRYVNEFVRVKAEGGFNALVGRPDRLNDDPNGSEAQIRPYIQWCLDTFDPAVKVVDFSQVPWDDIRRSAGGGTIDAPPPNIEKFDVFVRNDGTKDELYEVIDASVVPIVRNHVFEFPSVAEDQETTCLISS
jgi:hypothetical protein